MKIFQILILSSLAACSFDPGGIPAADDLPDAGETEADGGDAIDAGGDAPDAGSTDADVPSPDAAPLTGCTITCTDLQSTNDGIDSWTVQVQGPILNSLCAAPVTPTPTSKLRVAGDFNNWMPLPRDEREYLGEETVHEMAVAKNAGHFNLLLDSAWFDLSGGCEPEPATPVHCTVVDAATNTDCHLDAAGGSILF